ncbi:MAG TPA: PIN domain-containing protein [Solirubrobacterales bacterium]|nr:PIN domain-containing protein [Solirubrobacterales bacterium]
MNRTETLLLDASVWIAARDPEDRFREPARELALDVSRPIAAMDLTFYEVANAMGSKKGQVGEARHLLRFVAERCGEQIVAADPALLEAAVEVAVEHNLTAYDAAYVAAARRHGWTLISADIADLVSKGLAVAPDAADYPLAG